MRQAEEHPHRPDGQQPPPARRGEVRSDAPAHRVAGHEQPPRRTRREDATLQRAAPPAERVPKLMADLLDWLATTREHPLVASCIFHYEFEFIHPFADGNGRMGRLWQTLLLSRWQPALAWLPVESLIHQRQAAYYQALNDSTAATDCAPCTKAASSA